MNHEFLKNLIGKLKTGSERDILSTERDGAYFAALCPDRSNVIEWFPFRKEQTLLQVGAACGAFHILADRVASWDIYDADPLALQAAEARLEAAERTCPHGPETEKTGLFAAGKQANAANRTSEGGRDCPDQANRRFGERNCSPVPQTSLPEVEPPGRIHFTEIQPSKHYDILFLAQWPGEEKAREMIRTGTPEIVLALAENADALKFAAGAARDPEVCYATADQLEHLLDSAHDSQNGAAGSADQTALSAETVNDPENSADFHLYYPLPSILQAKDIRSDKALPGPGDFRGVAANFTDGRLIACDEEALYDALASHDPGTIRKFAPGYLAVYIIQGNISGKSARAAEVSPESENPVPAVSDKNPEGTETELCRRTGEEVNERTGEEIHERTGEEVYIKLPDYIRYNRSRRPQYQIRTDLYAGREVIKSALTPEADAHIADFTKRYQLLNSHVPEGLEVLPVRVFVNENGRAAAAFPFVTGRSLGHRLAQKIRNGQAPAREMEEALKLMLGSAGEPAGSRDSLDFEEKPEKQPQQAEQARPCCSPQYNIDLLFDNVLEEAGKAYLSDYEWISEQPLDPRFVRYRTLRYFYEDNAQSLTAYRNLAEYLKAFGFEKDEQSNCEQLEDEFQLKVHGSGKLSFEERFRRPSSSVTQIRENARLQYADQVQELKAILSKEREVERLSQQHISNIETMNRQKDAQIEALNTEIAYLRKHASLTAKAKRKLVARLDVWAPADSDRRIVIKHMKGTLKHPSVYIKNYLTPQGHKYLEGSFAIRGEFLEGGILELPEIPAASAGESVSAPAGARPLVSIIIPAYNQVGYTYACIRSILQHTDAAATPYEVILADDASSDATGHITDWIKNLKVARTAGNLGFLRNCNHAAKQAQGDYLFFLNNDTKVTDGWLSSLIRLMEQDESIGMCGSKLVFPDGKLQEAGGIIWSDGSGWNYGRGDDPAKCTYNYVKDVDYISGAAILIRKPLWDEIGGFDERYAPAYCEDSDLAFEVRRHGKRVVYQPDSVVIHFEGISNGTDVNGSGLKHYQLVNQEKFKEKWAGELAEQSVNTGNPNPFAARERTQNKPAILVIDHYVPMWDRDAGSKTTYQYLKMFLKKGYNVKFLGDDFRSEQPYTHELEQLGIEVLYGNEMRTGVYHWLEENKNFIDIAYLNRPHIASKYLDYLKDNTKIKCIFYGHDLHYLRIRREFELTGDIAKQRESENWRGLEYQVMEKSDMVYYPSRDEIDEIVSRRPEIPAKAITAYIYDKAEDPEPEERGDAEREFGLHNIETDGTGSQKNSLHNIVKSGEPEHLNNIKAPGTPIDLYNTGTDGTGLRESNRKDTGSETASSFAPNTEGLLFVGGFKHPPNADGVLWFAKEIWPRIHAALPEVRFYVAGSSPTPEILELSGKDNIEVLGFVSDERLKELYETTRITVVPLRYGAGVKGKVVEALDRDCVIVTTTVGAEGIPEAETAMDIVDAPEVFAREVIRLYQDPAELARRRAACAPLIRRHYSTEAAWSIIAEDFPSTRRDVPLRSKP